MFSKDNARAKAQFRAAATRPAFCEREEPLDYF